MLEYILVVIIQYVVLLIISIVVLDFPNFSRNLGTRQSINVAAIKHKSSSAIRSERSLRINSRIVKAVMKVVKESADRLRR